MPHLPMPGSMAMDGSYADGQRPKPSLPSSSPGFPSLMEDGMFGRCAVRCPGQRLKTASKCRRRDAEPADQCIHSLLRPKQSMDLMLAFSCFAHLICVQCSMMEFTTDDNWRQPKRLKTENASTSAAIASLSFKPQARSNPFKQT